MQLPGAFAVNETGAATYTIPLSLPPGVGGVEPKLELVYSSQRGNGPLGVGWALSGLSAITRCPQTMAQDGVRGAVNFDASDRFCLDGQRLVVTSGTYGFKRAQYGTEVESYKRVTHVGPVTDGDAVGPFAFVVTTKEGLTMTYGGTDDSRLQVFGKDTHVAWLLSRVQDRLGNFYEVIYTKDTVNGVAYPARINYTGNGTTGLAAASSVFFDYELRADGTPAFHAGNRVGSPTQRLARIRTETDAGKRQVMEYRLRYGSSPSTGRSRLESVLMCTWRGECLPATTFTWTASGTAASAINSPTPAYATDGDDVRSMAGDYDADGRTDMLLRRPNWTTTPILFSNRDGSWKETNLPLPFDINGRTGGRPGPPRKAGDYYQFPLEGDINGDGRQDVLAFYAQLIEDLPGEPGDPNVAGQWRTVLNVAFSKGDGTWSAKGLEMPPNLMSHFVFDRPESLILLMGDFDGDGKADLLLRSPHTSLTIFRSVGDGNWVRMLGGVPDLFREPTARMLVGDFDGDGKQDLVFRAPGWTSLPILFSNGNGTWRAVNAAAPAFATGSAEWLAADVNGDGKTDLVFRDKAAGTLPVLFARGDGTWAAPASPGMPEAGKPYVQTGKCVVGDFNSDGRHDLACAQEDAATIAYFFSKGDGAWSLSTFERPTWARKGQLTVGDFNGDAVADIAMRANGASAIPVLLSFGENGERIEAITRGGVVTVQIETGALGEGDFYTRGAVVTPPMAVLTPAMRVVKRVREDNGQGGFKTTRYSYDSAVVELGTGRGFMGFDLVAARDDDLGIDTVLRYRYDWPFAGRLRSRRVTKGPAAAGTLPITVSAMSAQFTCQNPATAPAVVAPGSGAAAVAPGQPGNCVVAPGSRYQVWASRTIESGQDLNGARLYNRTTDVSDMDKFGNPGRVRVDTLNPDGSVSGNVQWTDTWYSNDEGLWLLGLPIQRSVTVTKP